MAEESAIVGFTVLYCYSNTESMSHVGGVGTFILPSVRVKGAGTLLNQALVAAARKLGYEKLIVEVRKQNKIGLRLYEKCGFSRIGELKNQIKIGNRYDTMVLMKKLI